MNELQKIESETSDCITLSNLQNTSISPILWYRIHILLFGLHHLNDQPSKDRLESVTNPSYIGLPYFNASKADAIKNTLIDGKKLKQITEEKLNERLNRPMKERVESQENRVCVADDLAPILGKALKIDRKKLKKDRKL